MAPNRDLDSLERDFDRCLKIVVGGFKEHDIELEAGSVTSLTLELFRDYRKNTPRDVTYTMIEGELDALKLEKQLFGKKKRR